MATDFFHRTSDYYVRDDYEGVMFRYDSESNRYFRRFVNENFEKEASRESKLLFDTISTGQEITREEYMKDVRQI